MAFVMTLWIGNSAVLNSSSQWQLNEFLKLNYSGHDFFFCYRIQKKDLHLRSFSNHEKILIIFDTCRSIQYTVFFLDRSTATASVIL